MSTLSATSNGARPSLLVFGIDFGTTYSGVTWAWSKKPKDVTTIANWDSTLYQNSTREKVPSAICYDSATGDVAGWGYNIPLEAEPIRWFKLLLLNRDDLYAYLHKRKGFSKIIKARKRIKGMGKTPVDVIADYLRVLWAHVMAKVAKQLGAKHLRGIPFSVVMTVPAIWKPYACAKMMKAAKDAGIISDRDCGPTTLTFISEPESAARATFADMDVRPDLNVGDCITVADCGGGTVRVIGSPLWSQARPEDIKDIMESSWENGIKQQFSSEEKSWPVKLPYTMANLLRSDPLDPPTIEDMVAQQASKVEKKTGNLPKVGPWGYMATHQSPKYIVLVGSFGRCRYLFERLSTLFEGRMTEVLQGEGERLWTAISRGVVLSSISSPVVISSRVSRVHYGVRHMDLFVEGKHLKEDEIWITTTCQRMANNQVKWFLKRETAPDRLDSSVEQLCTIRLEPPIPFEDLPSSINPQGKPVKTFSYTVVMTSFRSLVRFDVEYEAKTIGESNVDVVFEESSSSAIKASD
ncbi:hypothetical protein B0T22DRAFT_534857 [Podospora appendiculata]|uniref:Uncharacterized protein n=1 Tax=Podospora appendiculata TaxID=314037 RepID=A0AAE0X7W8_9PEZI|nr:hypothetical protein B0T22DRAFT_534857 [Podospora appendiculata]